ncbi:MAG: hypothetical protein OXM02_12435 [Bacteroidota bacterium]|nr:hypothetical protein [Bacteroidota bacterium]
MVGSLHQPIMIPGPFAVFLILTGVVLVAVFLAGRYKLFRSLSAALVAMALFDVGLIPGDSEAYDVLIDPGISLGIVLILLGVKLRTIRQAGPAMLVAAVWPFCRR